MNRLETKNILITGASKGLGRALAIAFAKENVAAISLVARNKTKLQELQYEIQKIAPLVKIVLISADISVQEDIERVIATSLNAFDGKIDVLVNNASLLGPTPMPLLLDYPLEDFKKVINTNLIGSFLMIRGILPSMIENGGSIINVSSDAGIVGYPRWGAYGISKFGLEGMSQTWAAELSETGVRVNWVDPGSMNTDMHKAAEPEENPDLWASPDSVVEVFIYLASNESINISGQRFQAQEEWHEHIKLKP